MQPVFPDMLLTRYHVLPVESVTDELETTGLLPLLPRQNHAVLAPVPPSKTQWPEVLSGFVDDRPKAILWLLSLM